MHEVAKHDKPVWATLTTRSASVHMTDCPDWTSYGGGSPLAVLTVRVVFKRWGTDPWTVASINLAGRNRRKDGSLGVINERNPYWRGGPQWMADLIAELEAELDAEQ